MNVEIYGPILASLLAGGLIGFEREFHSRPAGLRTHALVCLASAVLMLAATRQDEWNLHLVLGESLVTDPTRMAHGVLTGIGFLCAGVIFRDGFSVQGLTTATSVWITASVGLLFGVGLYELGSAATVATVVVLVGVHRTYQWLPRTARGDIRVRTRRETAFDEAALRRLLTGLGLDFLALSHRLVPDGDLIEHLGRIRGSRAIPAETLGKALAALPDVVEFEITLHNE